MQRGLPRRGPSIRIHSRGRGWRGTPAARPPRRGPRRRSVRARGCRRAAGRGIRRLSYDPPGGRAERRAAPPMDATSPRWREITVSEYPWERDALAFVRGRLPDVEPYRVWSNFEFIADDGSINEVDLLALTPKGFFLVEIKSAPRFRAPTPGRGCGGSRARTASGSDRRGAVRARRPRAAPRTASTRTRCRTR